MIARLQKEFLLEQSAKQAFRSDDAKSVFSIYSHLNTPVSFGSPFARLLVLKDSDIIEISQNAKFLNDLYRDCQIGKDGAYNLKYNLSNQYEVLSNTASRLVDKCRTLNSILQAESRRQANYAEWFTVENFTTLSSIASSSTDVQIDFSRGVLTLSRENQTLDISRVSITKIACKSANETNGVISVDFSGSNESCEAVIECGLIFITSLRLALTGTPLNVKVYVYSTNWEEAASIVADTPKEILIGRLTQGKVKLVFSPVTSIFPTRSVISEIELIRSKFVSTGTYISSAIIPKVAFNQINLDVKATIPEGCSLTTYWSTDNTNFYPVEKGWFLIASGSDQRTDIEISSLEEGGQQYFSEALLTLPSNRFDSKLWVGVDQWELSAIKRNAIDSGDLDFIPYQDLFQGLNSTCWVTPGTMSSSSGLEVDVQVQAYSTTNSSCSRGSSPIAVHDIGLDYTASTIVPLSTSTASSILRKNYVYKYETNIYCLKDITIEDGQVWFIQGYKTPDTRTFDSENISYCSYSFSVNGVVISASSQPKTLYSDGTAEDGARIGDSLQYTLSKGWNKITILIYAPERPELYQTSSVLDEEFVQLTLYPNLLDSTFKEVNEVTAASASMFKLAINEFDLTWNMPKSLKYWSWRESNPDRLVFNTNTSDVIDGFIGGTGYTPNLRLDYTDLGAITNKFTNVNQLFLKMVLIANSDNNLSPEVDNYTVLVR